MHLLHQLPLRADTVENANQHCPQQRPRRDAWLRTFSSASISQQTADLYWRALRLPSRESSAADATLQRSPRACRKSKTLGGRVDAAHGLQGGKSIPLSTHRAQRAVSSALGMSVPVSAAFQHEPSRIETDTNSYKECGTSRQTILHFCLIIGTVEVRHRCQRLRCGLPAASIGQTSLGRRHVLYEGVRAMVIEAPRYPWRGPTSTARPLMEASHQLGVSRAAIFSLQLPAAMGVHS